MNVRLKTGVFKWTPGWNIILEQLGIACEGIEDLESLSPDQLQCVIVNRALDSRERGAVEAYLHGGGAVLDCGYLLPVSEPDLITRRYRKAIFREKRDTLFADIWILDVYDRVLHHKNGQYLDGSVLLEQRHDGFLAFLGFDVDRLMIDTRTCRKSFPAPGSPPNEVVSRVSKGALRKITEIALKWLCHCRNLPWIRLADFPDGDKTLFAFRIDSDYGTQEQVETMRRIADDRNVRMTWFLHVEAHKNWLKVFRAFEGHELAAHGYRHKVFPSVRENRDNFSKAAEALTAAGIETEAMAVPTGRWTHDIGLLIEENGFAYSSEFALDYDDVPFHPWMGDRSGSALQVPIHPVCIGNLIRAGQKPEEMMAYYKMVIEKKRASGEALIFYHHPPHAHWSVMEFILEEGMKDGARNWTLGEYARWWKARTKTAVTAALNATVVDIEMEAASPDIVLELERADGLTVLVNKNDSLDLRDDSRWSDRTREKVALPDGIGSLRSPGFDLVKQSMLDFYWRMKQ